MAEPRVVFAHALRGVAAGAVVLFHYCGVFWTWPGAVSGLIGMPAIESGERLGLLTTMFEPRTWFSVGHFGVALFFLISGFVIPASFARQSRRGFALGRVWRLWPTYAVGLTVTLVFLSIASRAVDRPFPYAISDIAWHYALGLRDLAGSASIDGIVWTLEMEVRFYLVCLAIAPLLQRGRARPVVFTIAGLIAITLGLDRLLTSGIVSGNAAVRVVAALALSGQMVTYMFIGTLFYFRFAGIITLQALWTIAGAVSFAFVCLWPLGPQAAQSVDGGVSYVLALAVFGVSFACRDRVPDSRVLSWLAGISYPLYVVHAIPGYVVMRFALWHGGGPVVALAAALGWATFAAVVVHRLVEVPTHEIGRRIARR